MARGGNDKKTVLEMHGQESQAQRLKINIPASEEFTVKEHNTKPWLLVTPTRFKHKWKKSELWYRSMILDKEGHVLSAGLPKFRNLGEDVAETTDFERHLARLDRVLFTEKMDGSLAIRSVIDGQVIWRTRGTFEGGDVYGPAIRQVAQNWSALMDPSFMPDHSMHFEFVHPEYQVVVKYDKPDLVFLSAVDHSNLRLLDFHELSQVADEHDLHLVPLHELPHDSKKLAEMVKEYKDVEGVVARYAGEQKYIKLKGAQYLAQHSLRFSFGLRKSLDLCHQEDFANEQSFINHLYNLGMDFEVAQTRLPIFYVYEAGRSRALEDFADVEQFVNTYGDLAQDKHTRKQYAQLAKDAYADNRLRFAGCFAMADGGKNAEKWRKDTLGKRVEQALKESRIEIEDEESGEDS